MPEWLEPLLDEDIIIPVAGIAAGAFIVIGGAIAYAWYQLRARQIEADLKRDMLDRGLSSEEIERIIRVTPAEPEDSFERTFKSLFRRGNTKS
jgi:hypothetical protein